MAESDRERNPPRLVRDGEEGNGQDAMTVDPGEAELPDDVMPVSLSPEPDPPMSPTIEAKVEQEVDDHPMEVEAEPSGFLVNDLVEIDGTKQKANNGQRGLIYAVDDLSHGRRPRLNVATILIEPNNLRAGSASVF